MSNVKPRREIKAELDQIATDFEQAKIDHEAREAELSTQIETLEAQAATTQTELDEAQAALITETEAREAATTASTEAQATIAELTDQVEKQRLALANPALVDAAMTGSEIDQAAEDAEADQAEASAEAQEVAAENLTISEQYQAMDAGPERIAFWDKHKRVIIQETA